MKKNIVLFFIFTGLLVFAYFFEEKGKAMKMEQQHKTVALFDEAGLGELKSIETSKLHLILENGHYFSKDSNRLIDLRKLEEVFKLLGGIKIKSVIEPRDFTKEKLFFDNDKDKIKFTFLNRSIEFVLGKKVDYDQSFYMKVKEMINDQVIKDNWIVAIDESALDEFYQKETAHRSPVRYDRFKRIMNIDENFLKDLHFFPLHYVNPKDTVFAEILVNFKGRPEFKIDFSTYKTTPDLEKGYIYNFESFIRFHNVLKNLESSREIKLRKIKEEKMAEYNITDIENNVFDLVLYYDEKKDQYFATNSLYPESIFYFKEKPSGLLVHWKDFWVKN